MRLNEFTPVKNTLNEADARIQHVEDIVFWEGSAGAARALEAIRNLEKGGHNDVTIKWDGSPAIIFGRNDVGEFILTDKSGFTAKGYDGKSKNANDLEKMLLNRRKGQDIAPAFRNFASNMGDIFDEYEKATPKDFEGYFKGDLLYYNTPPIVNGNYMFTPNIVTYEINAQSEIGERVKRSKTAVVVHRVVNDQGMERPVGVYMNNFFLGDDVLVFPPTTVQDAPNINNSEVGLLKQLISKWASNLDTLLDKSYLSQNKMTDFANILYAYTNSKVDSGLSSLGKDFFNWLSTSSVSAVKQQRMFNHIQEQQAGWLALWKIVNSLMQLKNNVIQQFDDYDTDIKANIGASKGGEGYVLTHPDGDIKFVNRAGFSAANRANQRD